MALDTAMAVDTVMAVDTTMAVDTPADAPVSGAMPETAQAIISGPTLPSTHTIAGTPLGALPSSGVRPASIPSSPATASSSFHSGSSLSALGGDEDGFVALLHAGDQNWCEDHRAESDSASDVDLSMIDFSGLEPAFPWQEYASQGANSCNFGNFSYPVPSEQSFVPPMPPPPPMYPQGMSPADVSAILAQAHLVQQWSQNGYNFFGGSAFPNVPDMSLMSALGMICDRLSCT